MHLLMLEFIHVIALLTASVLSHVSENNGGTLANSSLEFRTSTTDEITTVIHTTNYVYHMEPDLHVPGNIIFSDSRALRTTDSVTTSTIAGTPYAGGNVVAVGQLARFGSIKAIRQISPTHIVVVDNSYQCLRLVDRLTLETPWYAGYCGSSGYSQGTTSARFYRPFGIILDKKRAGMLLVTDYSNDAIRHVQVKVGSGLSAVSEFHRSSSLDGPAGLAQDPISGDLYITTIYADKVFRLTYTTRSLSLLAGSTSGFVDGDFSSTRFNDATEIALIDNGRKLILTDQYNHRLRLLDLITRQTSSLCTGQTGRSNGDMSSCTLNRPCSLMVLNNTLYVGELYRIRKIQDACLAREYDVSPDTGLALVEVPGSRGTVKQSLPPGSHPFYLTFPTSSCTFEYHVNDRRELACPNPDVRETAASDTGLAVVDIPLCGSKTGKLSLPPGSYPLHITSDTFNCTVAYKIEDHRELACPYPEIQKTASSETGVAVVDVPLCGSRSGELSLPPGAYPLRITSDDFTCTVEYNVSDYRDSPCTNKELRQSVSADTGVALVDMAWSGLNGRLKVPPGNYQLEILSEGEMCTVDIGIADHRLRRRLVFEAQYDVECEPAEGNIAESPLTLTVAQHTFSFSEICSTDCRHHNGAGIDLSCTNHTLTVVWPSNLTYPGYVNRIPAELERRLTSRIVAKGLAFVLFLPEITPPIVYPEQGEHGGYMSAKFLSYCIGQDVSYVKATDSCEQQARVGM